MRNSYEKQFWKYVAHLQENKHTEQPYRTWTQTLDLDPEIRPRKTWTLKNVSHEKRSKQLDAKKKIGTPHSIIHYNTKIPKEETCTPGIWKKLLLRRFKNTGNVLNTKSKKEFKSDK